MLLGLLAIFAIALLIALPILIGTLIYVQLPTPIQSIICTSSSTQIVYNDSTIENNKIWIKLQNATGRTINNIKITNATGNFGPGIFEITKPPITPGITFDVNITMSNLLEKYFGRYDLEYFNDINNKIVHSTTIDCSKV